MAHASCWPNMLLIASSNNVSKRAQWLKKKNVAFHQRVHNKRSPGYTTWSYPSLTHSHADEWGETAAGAEAGRLECVKREKQKSRSKCRGKAGQKLDKSWVEAGPEQGSEPSARYTPSRSRAEAVQSSACNPFAIHPATSFVLSLHCHTPQCNDEQQRNFTGPG